MDEFDTLQEMHKSEDERKQAEDTEEEQETVDEVEEVEVACSAVIGQRFMGTVTLPNLTVATARLLSDQFAKCFRIVSVLLRECVISVRVVCVVSSFPAPDALEMR